MRVFLHSKTAAKSKRNTVTISPAGDTDFVKSADILDEWKFADGRPKQFPIYFEYGAAEVDDALGRYMVARGIAHKSRLLHLVRGIFDARGKPIGELYDADGRPILLDIPR